MIKNFIKGTGILIFFIHFIAAAFGQDLSKKIVVQNQAISVLNICNLLEREYNLKIAYSNTDEQLQKKITLKGGAYSLADFLNISLKKNNIKYQFTGQQIIIIPIIKRGNINETNANTITISGFVEDEETGEKLPGASIYIPGIEKGTITNNYGFFSITVTGSISELIVSYSGYKLYHNNTGFDTDMQLTVKLKSNRELEEIIVAATKNVPIQEQSQMSKINVPVSVIKNMPRFFGEADVLKTLQLLPGVSQGIEGTSGILVRGGTPDQNLMLLDGTPVYNASHLFGIFSTFNTSALKNVDVYKGGFPARFGSRLSSVVDIVTKDGNMKQIHGEANIGLLAASFTLEGPLKKDKTSFLISGRRTYLDLIAEPLLKSQEKEVKKFAAYFYDINLKLHHILSSKDRLFFSFYQGGDVLKFRNLYIGTEYFQDDKIEGGWGNIISAVRWNHVFSKKLFANTLINFTRYKLLSDLAITSGKNGATDMSAIKYFSSIYDVGSRIDFDYRPRPEHSVKFGASALQHFFTPGVFSLKSSNSQATEIDTTFNNNKQKLAEFSIYGEDDWQLSSKLKINAGVHASAFKAQTQWYSSIQPRIGLRYLLPQDVALKVSYTHMNQYVHLLSSNSTSLPTDLWVPSTDKVKPMLSRQISLGFAKAIFDNKIDISIESYYKKMNGVIEYKEGTSYLNSSTSAWDTKVEAGKGKSYGIEFLVQKNTGKLKGWIGYTLSHSKRIFPTINYGKEFDYKYDRRHDFEVAAVYALNTHWEVSGSWQFQTGNPFTVPIANYESMQETSPYNNPYINNQPIQYIQGRNQFRLLNYHRLDFGITWKKKKRRYEKSWNFSLYNAYNQQNPFFYTLQRYNESNSKKAVLWGTSILPILPSISYGIKF